MFLLHMLLHLVHLGLPAGDLVGWVGGCLYPQGDISNNLPRFIMGVPRNCIILFAIFW